LNIEKSIILINPESTNGFDLEYDSHFLAGYAPQFYSKIFGELFSTNSLNEIDATTIIPFGFVKNQAGNFFIRLTETIPDHTIYLTDLKQNITQSLSENPVYLVENNDNSSHITQPFQPASGEGGSPHWPNLASALGFSTPLGGGVRGSQMINFHQYIIAK